MKAQLTSQETQPALLAALHDRARVHTGEHTNLFKV
jgi:hypothetical protein